MAASQDDGQILARLHGGSLARGARAARNRQQMGSESKKQTVDCSGE